MGIFEVRNNIALMATSASLHLRRSVNFKGKKKIADSVLHTAFGWNG